MILPRCIPIILSLFLLTGSLRADPTAGAPNPGESVLIIYTNITANNVTLRDVFVTALTNIVPPALITEVVISAGDGLGPGFYDELVAQTGQTDLSSFCQVYDLRFRDDKNGVSWIGQDQEDVITSIGTNTDYDLYTDYLNNGGRLFLQGEHTDYNIRNTNMLMFINSVATSPITSIAPAMVWGAYAINEYMATPENFSTDFNNLAAIGSINSNFAGYILDAERGSGRPLIEVNAGAGAVALCWLPADLTTSTGRLVVSFETNGFIDKNAASDAWIQNTYDLLSGCWRYDITKTFIPDTGCVGDTGTFTLCYENTGATALTDIYIYDTIPTCLSFTSSNPAPTGNAGNVYWWYFATIPAATPDCITVNFDITTFPPCP